jgi:hypothetical protein
MFAKSRQLCLKILPFNTKIIISLVFKKKANSFCRKLVKIEKSSDHNCILFYFCGSFFQVFNVAETSSVAMTATSGMKINGS